MPRAPAVRLLLLLLLLALLLLGLGPAAAEEEEGRVEGSIITAPRRQRLGGCRRGQLLDRRGKCRTPY